MKARAWWPRASEIGTDIEQRRDAERDLEQDQERDARQPAVDAGKAPCPALAPQQHRDIDAR